MKRLNKKALILSLIALSIMLFATLVNAQELNEVTAWTDKPKYTSGEKGTLNIAFYNSRDVAVAVKNITLTYMTWRAYSSDMWIGNETRTLNVPVSGKNTVVFGDITFTVPTDGRGISTSVLIKVGTDHGFAYGSANVNVFETPSYMERIISLFTILVALLIVCTIIIAATIFLSSRRPQVTRIKEEKEE